MLLVRPELPFRPAMTHLPELQLTTLAASLVLAQVGLDGQSTAIIEVENGSIVLRKPAQTVRAGWAEAAAVLSAKGGGDLLMGEFGNLDDAELSW